MGLSGFMITFLNENLLEPRRNYSGSVRILSTYLKPNIRKTVEMPKRGATTSTWRQCMEAGD